MKIVVIGRGHVGGGLSRLWSSRGHQVTALGRDGGDATGAEVVVVAVAAPQIPDALGAVVGLAGQPTIDACNIYTDRQNEFPSLSHQIQSIIGGPTAKAFSTNFASAYNRIGEQRVAPSNLYAADDGARRYAEQLSVDAGYEPVYVGPLDPGARLLEDSSGLTRALAAQVGPFFYRYLDVVEVPRPAAGPGQVVVAVVTAATNPGEIGIREGHFAAIWPAHFPEGQGNDFAGYVAEIGSGVDDFAVGDEVLGFAPRAAQAEYVALSVDAVAAKPAGLSWEAAATIAGAGATAWASVAAVNPQPGETIVVSAAAGGVGMYAAQLARLGGADVIGTCSETNVDLLTSLGIRPAQYGPGLSRRLGCLAPNGIDGYIDTFGSGNVSLAVSLGVEPDRINTLTDQEAVQRFGVHSDAQEQADTPRIWAELAKLVARGDITVPIATVYDFTTEHVRQAYRDVGTRHVSGKRVLRIMPAHNQTRHT